jgi:hypothetical protein
MSERGIFIEGDGGHPLFFSEAEFHRFDDGEPYNRMTAYLWAGMYSPLRMSVPALGRAWRWSPKKTRIYIHRMVGLGFFKFDGLSIIAVDFNEAVPTPIEGCWESLRMVVFERDHFRCTYCGSGENLQCDHIIPRARGGMDVLENLTTACRSCNASKRDRLLSEWRARDAASRLSHGQGVTSRDSADGNLAVVGGGNASPQRPVAAPESVTLRGAEPLSLSNPPVRISKGEKKERAKRNRGICLPATWAPSESHFEEGAALGFGRADVLNQAHDLRLWASANEHRSVARKTDLKGLDLSFSAWMRRNAPKRQQRQLPLVAPVEASNGDQQARTYQRSRDNWRGALAELDEGIAAAESAAAAASDSGDESDAPAVQIVAAARRG